jgi:hypothetical protein
MEDFIILFVSFIIIMGLINIYKTHTSKVKYVKSNLYKNDNNEYLVRYKDGIIDEPGHDSECGANALSFIRENLILLVKAVQKKNCDNTGKDCKKNIKDIKKKNIKPKEIEMLIQRFNPDNISESTPDNKYTSYSVNKGEKVIFCIRDKKTHKIIDSNTLMFVAIHELAHIMTISIGHGDDFWNNMKYLLTIAIKTPRRTDYNAASNFKKIHLNNNNNNNNNFIYKYVDYSQTGQGAPYCGTTITTTPCGTDQCSDGLS